MILPFPEMKVNRFNIITEYAIELLLSEHNLDKGLFLETLFSEKEGIDEVITLAHSSTIVFDPMIISATDILEFIEKADDFVEESKKDSERHDLPICFDNEFAIDKKEIVRRSGLDWEEIKYIHLNTEYQVQMYGFMPGFFYMKNLDKRIQLERKERPSIKIPKGSVGIAHNYCGIYPTDSPGGWYIIGKSKPISMQSLSIESNIPDVGDLIRFYEVAKSDL